METFEEYLPWQKMSLEELEEHYSPSRWSARFTGDEIIEKHVNLAEKVATDVVSKIYCRLNVRYGHEFKQKFDIFSEDLPPDSSILLYVHGGYWQELNKNLSWFPTESMRKHNIVTVILGYTLAPEAKLEKIVEEVSDGIKYVCDLAEQRGSKGVFLAGWSAGAHLITQALSTTLFNNEIIQKYVKGIIALAGVFDLRPLVSTYVNKPLFLTSESSWQLSPMKHIANLNKDLSFLIAFGEFDSPEFQRQSTQLYKLLQKEKITATLHEIKDEDHFSLIEQLSCDGYSLINIINQFIHA